MKQPKIIAISLDDIIFENRNRAYGAYSLRKGYNRNLFFSVFIAITSFSSILILFNRALNGGGPPDLPYYADTSAYVGTYIEVELPKVKEVDPPPPAGGLKPLIDPFSWKPVADSATAPRDTSSLALIAGPVASPAIGTGTGTTTTIPGYGTDTASAGTGNSENEVHRMPDVMPEFPGGNAALSRFMQRHIQYPLEAYNRGKEGKVILSFVVSREGVVKDVEVVDGIGYGCNEEAVRVVKKMPRWKPGRNKGTAVNVRFYIPIEFRLNK